MSSGDLPSTLQVEHLDQRDRRTLHRLTATDDGLALLRAMADLSDALTAERVANSDAARAAAQKLALAARDQLNLLTGVTGLEKRRAYANAAGLADGGACDAADWDRVVINARDRSTDRHKAFLRMARMQNHFDDASMWGVTTANALVWQEMQHAKGMEGPLDLQDQAAEAALVKLEADDSLQRVKKSGVSGKDGATATALTVAVCWFAEVCADVAGAKGDIPEDVWNRGHRRFLEACDDADIRDAKGRPWRPKYSTFRTLMSKADRKYGPIFNQRRQERAEENEQKAKLRK